ncbi:MAG: hypothetical protein H0X38_15350 [Planctomycetes bacterium]|nr:hypothetical protein [Planctomycetota bacterium]
MLTTLLIISSVLTNDVFAESATYCWQAKQVEEHPFIGQFKMDGPRHRNQAPKSEAFTGQYYSWPQQGATLERASLITVGEDGVIKTTEFTFKTLQTIAAEDGQRVITRFETGNVGCHEGDIIILVFKVEGKMTLLSSRLSILIVRS